MSQLKLSDLFDSGHIGYTAKMVYSLMRLANEFLTVYKREDWDLSEKILEQLDTVLHRLKLQVIASRQVSKYDNQYKQKRR